MAEKKSAKTTASKKPVAKKAVVKKTAVKKTVSKPTASKKPAAAKKAVGSLTRVVAKADAGWGNSLYIRGNGAGLSWHKGVLMQCVDADEWLWENKVSKGTVEFKVLINDEIWAIGDDISVNAGDSVTCHPVFQ